jgi:hypothetical protein
MKKLKKETLKPRNFVAKHAPRSGAGKHSGKKAYERRPKHRNQAKEE